MGFEEIIEGEGVDGRKDPRLSPGARQYLEAKQKLVGQTQRFKRSQL